jgi:tripeptidyl-peptidase I
MSALALSKLLAFLSVVAVVSASLVLHEGRTAPPYEFTSTGPAPADQSITLRVALTSNNIAGLESKLGSISTPDSKDFRQWLSAGMLHGHSLCHHVLTVL